MLYTNVDDAGNKTFIAIREIYQSHFYYLNS